VRTEKFGLKKMVNEGSTRSFSCFLSLMDILKEGKSGGKIESERVIAGILLHLIKCRAGGGGAGEECVNKCTLFLFFRLFNDSCLKSSLNSFSNNLQKLCYVALDYDSEMKKDRSASCEVAGEGWFTLSKERYQVGELLFQPHLGGV
jgi:hypothetical protein